MIGESEIQEMLWALNDDRISLEEFERWFGPASVNMHKESSPEAMKKASEIHFLFSDRDGGHIDDAQLRRELLSLLDNVVVYLRIDRNLVLSNVPPDVLSSNSSQAEPVSLHV